MEKKDSAELLNIEQNSSKNASSDSLNSDSKSSSLNSKMGQESVIYLGLINSISYWFKNKRI